MAVLARFEFSDGAVCYNASNFHECLRSTADSQAYANAITQYMEKSYPGRPDNFNSNAPTISSNDPRIVSDLGQRYRAIADGALRSMGY